MLCCPKGLLGVSSVYPMLKEMIKKALNDLSLHFEFSASS